MSVAITLDIDWVPDSVIDAVAARLVAGGVRATWFVTHASAAVERLREHPALFELGIHPNFLVGSTHGASPETVLAHCMALVPDARAMRTHSLVQSTPLLEQIIRHTPIECDVSLFLPGHRALQAVEQPLSTRTLRRLPFWWEDDFALYAPTPDLALVPQLESGGDGLRILNFHPIHVALNSRDFGRYEALKRETPRLTDATAEQIERFTNRAGTGIGAAFDAVVQWLAARGGGHTISALAADPARPARAA